MASAMDGEAEFYIGGAGRLWVSYNQGEKHEASVEEWLYVFRNAPEVIQMLEGHA